MTAKSNSVPVRRRSVLAGVGLTLLLSVAPLGAVHAEDIGGELVILQWLGGTEAEMWKKVEDAFVAKNPAVKIRELVVTGQGDMRGAMRTALLGGEVVDIIINTWPAFRAELLQAGLLRPIDEQWSKYGWDKKLSQSWKDLGSIDGKTYGITYTYGDRSGVWYKPAHLKKAGIDAPKTWDEFLASFDKLKAAGYGTPVAIGAKYWSHTEWFESLLLRTAGVETAAKLARHEIPWTDAAVKTALKKYAEMLKAGCCGDPTAMFANDWDAAADQLFKADVSNYQVIGMWVNARARNDYGLTEGTDYSLFQFPALGMGNDDTSSVDAKELNVTANGKNPAAADAFMDFMVSGEAANLMASFGFASPSSEADNSLLGPAQQVATGAVGASKVQFVLGDLLPGDLVDEYRVQLQKFLQDPSDANIDAVTAAIEAKAADFVLMAADSVVSGATASAETHSSGPQRARDERRKLLATRGWRLRDTPAAWLLILPVLVLFGAAVVFPLVDTIRLSLFDIKGLAQPKYVGFGNYARLFADPAFRNTLTTTLIFTLGTTSISVGIGWVLAMLCSFAPQRTLPFRVMIFAAFGISETVVGYMWVSMLRPDAGGLLNSIIRMFGFPDFAQPWLGDPRTALWALIVAASWGAVGLPLMLCFASVQAIPKSVLEAAYMDGARPTRIMRYIMMPLSLPGVRVAIFINLLNALRAFDVIYVLTGGGPVRSTETVGYFMYRESMTQFKLGYGAAATVILLLAVLIVSIPAIIQRTAGAK